MTYERFEDLPVWQRAIELAEQIYQFTSHSAFQKQFSLRDQLERAAVSVSNNIAEGFERGTTQELLTFLYIARGSAGEVRSMLSLISRLDRFKDLKFQISNLQSLAEQCSGQLRGWANALQNSPIEGQRKLNDTIRQRDTAYRKAEATQKMLLEKLPFEHPLRKAKEGR